MVSSTLESRAASSRIWSSYALPLASAAAKIVGLVVTPTTLESATSSARLPVLILVRDRSSSQMETPASERAFSRSLMSMSLSWGSLRVLRLGSADGDAGIRLEVGRRLGAAGGGVGRGKRFARLRRGFD